ncbi:MAG: hypothetical protein JWR19_1092 [Pedosphaera sp.]|nr:hypothetical protein [Pedosphaera sp.]
MLLTINVKSLLVCCLLAITLFNGKGFLEVAAADVTVVLNATHQSATVPSDFAGLSFEMAQLLPDTNGVCYFRQDNQPLIDLFRTLDVRSLRIGGNTPDQDAAKLLGPSEWKYFFAFAQAAHVKIIYGLQLYKGDSTVAAQTVQYLMDHYASQIEAFPSARNQVLIRLVRQTNIQTYMRGN